MPPPDNKKLFALFKTILKIPVFKGFESEEAQQLLRVCQMKSIPAGTKIYSQGEPSLDMLILLRGQLSVQGPGGLEYARLGPGSPAGEMGMLTYEPRSADVIATNDSTALFLRRNALEAGTGKLLAKIQQNVITILCDRLADTSDQLQQRTRELQALKRSTDQDDDEDDDEYVEEDDEEI